MPLQSDDCTILYSTVGTAIKWFVTAAYDARDYERCAKLYAQLVARIADDSEKPYQAARCFALAGKKAEAFDQFDRAVERGFVDADHLLKDPELTGLHGDARWVPLVERTRARLRGHELMWKNPVFKSPYRENLSEDEKVAGLSRLWSEAKFNFVYFAKVPTLDWDALKRIRGGTPPLHPKCRRSCSLPGGRI